MPITTLLIILLAAGVVLAMCPVDPAFRKMVIVVAVILTVLVLLRLVGVWL